MKNIVKKEPAQDSDRRHSLKKSLIIFPLMLFIINCTTSAPAKQTEIKSNKPWNELSKFIAGMPVPRESIYWELSQTKAYQVHINYIDKFWKTVEKKAISQIEPWRNQNISSKLDGKTVFYPLSGADFIYMYSMFPNDTDFLMIATEAPGNMEWLSSLSPKQLSSGLASVRRLLYLYGLYNYFQSVIMKTEMHKFSIKGTTPVILLFMARMGMTIHDVKDIMIDEQGNLIENKNIDPKEYNKNQYTGSKIVFSSPGSSTLRTVNYLKLKLNDATLSESTPSGKYLNKLNDLKTMLKSAVYLCHYRKYNSVKDYILNKSIFIIQDDSGVPFKFFDKKEWDIKLFGIYFTDFELIDTKVMKQWELAKSYKGIYKGIWSPLPFKYGYGGIFQTNKSNLMIAERKPASGNNP